MPDVEEHGPHRESCSRCNRESPPFTAGPEGAAAQGWITLAGPEAFDTYEDNNLDAWPVIYGVSQEHLGSVCPGCLTEAESTMYAEGGATND